MTPHRAAAAGAVLASALVLSACGSGATTTATTATTAATGSTPGTTTASSSPTAAAAVRSAPTTATPSGAAATAAASRAATTAPLVVDAAGDHLRGRTRSLDYDITLPTFSGGAQAAAATARVRASAQSAVDDAAQPVGGLDDADAHHTLEGQGAVTTDDGRTVQAVIELGDYYDGAAHPSEVVNTVVLDARTGAPVTLDQVFTDPRAAFTAMAPVVRAVAAAAGEDVTEDDGLGPDVADWAAWQTTPDGFEVHFQDYQLGGHGLRVYTVPWADAAPLMTPAARALLAP